jgi:hypothetical protein
MFGVTPINARSRSLTKGAQSNSSRADFNPAPTKYVPGRQELRTLITQDCIEHEMVCLFARQVGVRCDVHKSGKGRRQRTSRAWQISGKTRRMQRLPHARLFSRKARYGAFPWRVRRWLRGAGLGHFRGSKPHSRQGYWTWQLDQGRNHHGFSNRGSTRRACPWAANAVALLCGADPIRCQRHRGLFTESPACPPSYSRAIRLGRKG